MATAPRIDPRTVVKSSTRVWADQVGLAEAGEIVPPYDPAYQFSNGKQTVEKTHYQPADVPDPLP